MHACNAKNHPFVMDEPLNLDRVGTNNLTTNRPDVNPASLDGGVLKHRATKAWLDVPRA